MSLIPPREAPATEWLWRLRWPLVVLALGAFALVAYLETLRHTREIAGAVGQRVEGLAERFRSGSISHTFAAALPQLVSSGTGRLELATAEAVETFEARDEVKLFWEQLSLGETVSSIRVPVTYRYHVSLDEPWRLDVADGTCTVLAPPIRPSLPVAIHTDRMEKRTAAGWLRFNAEQQMADLERSITPTLERYATDRRHLRLVREECRRTVAEFVRGWLLREDHWRADRFRSIVVLFADEAGVDPGTAPPTLRLD